MDAIGDDGSLRLDVEKPIGEIESGYTYFRNGDVTVAKITPCYENGKGALMAGLKNDLGFGTTELIVARPKPKEVSGPYLHYIFISPDFRSLGESHMYGAGGQKRVPDAFVRNFATGFPPLPEQTQIAVGAINFDGLPCMDIHEDEYERYIVKTGDLLVCEGGEVGRAAIVPPISAIFGYQKALHGLRALDSSEDSRFMYFTLLWAANTGTFDQSGSSTIAHLTGEQLRKYRFPKPPFQEQKAIATFLETESAKFDTLTTEAQRAIDLLQERRTALISAAVTGQIDVRGAD